MHHYSREYWETDLQTFPRPTARPNDERKNSQWFPQDSLSGSAAADSDWTFLAIFADWVVTRDRDNPYQLPNRQVKNAE